MQCQNNEPKYRVQVKYNVDCMGDYLSCAVTKVIHSLIHYFPPTISHTIQTMNTNLLWIHWCYNKVKVNIESFIWHESRRHMSVLVNHGVISTSRIVWEWMRPWMRRQIKRPKINGKKKLEVNSSLYLIKRWVNPVPKLLLLFVCENTFQV